MHGLGTWVEDEVKPGIVDPHAIPETDYKAGFGLILVYDFGGGTLDVVRLVSCMGSRLIAVCGSPAQLLLIIIRRTSDLDDAPCFIRTARI